MKRRILHLIPLTIILLLSIKASAQSGPYGNEWIDFSKTYYKFKVGTTGSCRIYRSALSTAGIPASVLGSNFMLYRDGKEIPVYVSADNMTATDYIEFWGKKADGLLDKELYAKPEWQPNDRVSLFSDSATYFLTYDAGTSHLRYAQNPNAIPSGTLSPEPFILAKTFIYSKGTFSPGPSYTDNGNELVSAEFDNGEGWLTSGGAITTPTSMTLTAPNLVPGYPGTLHTTYWVRAYYGQTHQARMTVNGTQFADSSLAAMDTKHFDIAIPASVIANSNTLTFTAYNIGTYANSDFHGIMFGELEYPRSLDFNGLSQLTATLPATGAPQYLEVYNLGAGRIYDITNRKWYDGNTSIAGKTRFYLDPSTVTREIGLVQDVATRAVLTPLGSVQFTDYSTAAKQGNFIIISHSDLLQNSNGRNYIQEYASYRLAPVGGGHSVVIADVKELYDQFAYGYDIHPLAIKHFLQFSYNTWNVKPADVLLAGRGLLYKYYPGYLAARNLYTYPIVPTYGDPGSDEDFTIWGGSNIPKLRIGRVPIWKSSELGTYLDKVIAYDAASRPATSPTPATEIWKKRVMHLIGATDAVLQDEFERTMDNGAEIIRDTLTGMTVSKFAKDVNQPVAPIAIAQVDSLLHDGVAQITFYGHASSQNFDFELPSPSTYTPVEGRLPFFVALGCDVGHMFELSNIRTIEENYVLAPNSGSIGFIGADALSFAGFDDPYLPSLYYSMAQINYAHPYGDHIIEPFKVLNSTARNPNFNSIQLESMIYSGDPSVTLPSAPKPDYYIGSESIAAVPSSVSTALDSFTLRIAALNLGKALNDSVLVKVEHINPVNVTSTATTYTIRNLHFSDTSSIRIAINKTTDLGLNKYRVTLDAADRYDEVSESNNTASFELYIYSNNLVPAYPKEFAIVNQQGITLKASTLNPFRGTGHYRIELDTTENFNSPSKQNTLITAGSGIVKWTPQITYIDSTVYYWRTTLDSQVNGDYQWTNSSFIYIAGGSPGWNQSHYFQYAKDIPNGIVLNADRSFSYNPIDHRLEVRNCSIGGVSGNENVDGTNVQHYWDGQLLETSSNLSTNALQIFVVDSNGHIWRNTDSTTYGAYAPRAGTTTRGTYTREYDLSTQSKRVSAARFLDTIPKGWYVMMKNVWWHYRTGPQSAQGWKADSVITGSGNTLYDVIKRLGFNTIDSFNRERSFIFLRRKGDNSYPVYQTMTDSVKQILIQFYDIRVRAMEGRYRSAVIGPVKAWQTLQWKTAAIDANGINDTVSMSIFGIDTVGNESLIAPAIKGDTTLAWINAKQYRNIRLVWYSKDSVNTTTPQLRYWRVLASPAPEAALNPSAYYVFTDSLSQGQTETFGTAIENLSNIPMDSMLVRYKVIGADGISHLVGDRRYKPLAANDTLHAAITFDPAAYPGKNYFFIEANPANDQPEEYHPNNLGILPFRISVDNTNPLLDVTFDGVHILNGDIVSAKPYIKILLKDENQFLTLNDTGLLKVQLRYPGQTVPVDVPFDGASCRFVPAATGGKANEAVVEYRPQLPQDGTYQLSVTGADRSGNGAGATAGSNVRSTYHIEFEVDNKPGITRVLNYPNPFSTATAFLFTLTGYQIPSQLKIQVLSVTGKVVREITRNELGPLHIGRNITQYQWDGRDQFGQLLGNGVYMYRVVTSLDGQDVDLLGDGGKRDGPNTVDRFFKGGWGKMYIMR